jgi:hypothetical protein
MLDMCCLVLAGPRERLSWRLNLVPRSQDPFHRGCSHSDIGVFKVAAKVMQFIDTAKAVTCA